jgi:hypothetical protein
LILTPLTCLEGGALANLHPGLRYLARQTRMRAEPIPVKGSCRELVTNSPRTPRDTEAGARLCLSSQGDQGSCTHTHRMLVPSP